ncbi:MAG: antibiotic biosynthesis monooxygenase [Desulfobacterales bacterium]|nr:MAG: antibiotic biosynthesis monooxygenase [Desulfobacterales bacterium]
MQAVKVIIKRRFQEGKTKGVFALLNKFRSDAMEEPGYISGETLINYDDPREIVVIAMWQSIENWFSWKENELRKANEHQLERWLEEPAEIKTYVLGTYPPRKK